MGHLMSTMNNGAVERGTHPLPCPTRGHWVLFYPRPQEIRAGMQSVPALVLKSDPENMLLDLFLVYDADDYGRLEHVPMKMGDDRGWDYLDGSDNHAAAEAAANLEKFKREVAEAIFGPCIKSEESIYEMIADLRSRLAALEEWARKPVGPLPAETGKAKLKTR